MRKGFSLKSKLILLLLLVSLISAAVFGFLGWRNNRSTVTDLYFGALVAIRRSKADQLEAYFHSMRSQVETLSENDMVIDAMIAFNKSFRTLRNQSIPTNIEKGLENYYTTQFFPKLFANLPGEAEYGLYRPADPAGVYLQYHYVAANPYSTDAEKALLDDAKDGSDYSAAHAYYHPRLRNIIKRLGFYDILLISIDTGDVVYNVSKETDFASNMSNGPYRKGNAATAFELVRANPDRNSVQLVDFELYRPSYGTPSSFWSAPLYNGSHLVGVMLVQIALDEVNKIMTNNQSWSQVGLGKTGESYIVGQDLLLRSDSRYFLENPTDYIALLEANGTPERTLSLIKKLNTSILFQKINTDAAREATQGRDGVQLLTDYRGTDVIAAYQPITLETLQWGLVTEIDQNEAFVPIYNFQRILLITTVLMALIFTFASLYITNNFLQPFNHLIERVRLARQGQYDTDAQVKSNDEFGELAHSFNELAQNLHHYHLLVQQKDMEIGRLWTNVLPDILAQQVDRESIEAALSADLIEQTSQATVLVARIEGIHALTSEASPQQAVKYLQELTITFDGVAAHWEAERFSAFGQQWLAVCGLSHPFLDHSRRMVELGLAAQVGLERFNQKYSTHLQICIGIHAGSIATGIVGSTRLRGELWGETVKVAEALCANAQPNTILVSQAIYEQLQERYRFRSIPKPPNTWVLEGNKSPEA